MKNEELKFIIHHSFPIRSNRDHHSSFIKILRLRAFDTFGKLRLQSSGTKAQVPALVEVVELVETTLDTTPRAWFRVARNHTNQFINNY